MNKQLLIFLLVMGLIIAGLIYYHFEREQPVYSNIFFGLLPLTPATPTYAAVADNARPTITQSTRTWPQIKITPSG